VPTALVHGLPVLLAVALIALIYRLSGTRRAIYRLPEPWTHGPVLWAATDEVIPAARHGHHGQADREFTVGGGASGHW
jgi:hypothetical protein